MPSLSERLKSLGVQVGAHNLPPARQPDTKRIDQIAPGSVADVAKLAKAAIKSKSAPFGSAVADFYLSNLIARASAVMGECAATAAGLRQAAE